jgi:hypothetical protein
MERVLVIPHISNLVFLAEIAAISSFVVANGLLRSANCFTAPKASIRPEKCFGRNTAKEVALTAVEARVGRRQRSSQFG